MPAGGLSAEKAKNTEKTEDPPMRYRKRRKAAFQTMAMAVLVVAALAVLFVLVCSRVFIVRNIMIVGNRNLLQEEIITQSGIQVGDNLLGISSARLKEQLEQNRYIEYVGRDFDYQGTLTIRINEENAMRREKLESLILGIVKEQIAHISIATGNNAPASDALPETLEDDIAQMLGNLDLFN